MNSALTSRPNSKLSSLPRAVKHSVLERREENVGREPGDPVKWSLKRVYSTGLTWRRVLFYANTSG